MEKGSSEWSLEVWVAWCPLKKEDAGRAGWWVLSSQELSMSKGTEAEKQDLCWGIRGKGVQG